MKTLSKVQKFYDGKSIMITGGTGFLGKLLVEKLLRSCPGVKKLYLLVREKKGKDIKTRFNEVLEDPVFDRLKQEVPKFKEKIELVAGDCSESDLGISICDRKMLMEEVNIIFHLAATLKFNEHLKLALESNVRATMDLLRLAKTMHSLDVFMYVSTAYSNVPMPVIKEEFYNLGTDWAQLQATIKDLTHDEIEMILPKILGPWPNTYTFTKALAEKEILAHCDNTPIGVFRPAIVISTAQEPIKSWIDNLYGPTGIVVGCGSGVLRTVQCEESATADLVPGDYAVNCLVTAACDVHTAYTRSQPSQPPVYNYVSSVENKITWRGFYEYCETDYDRYPFYKAVWYRSLALNKSFIVYFIYKLFLHLIPAALVDIFRIIELKKPKILKLYKKIHEFTSIFVYFATRNIKFSNERTRMLWKTTSDEDKELFPFSMAELDWNEYFQGYTLGVRRYLLKEKDDQLPQAKIKLQRLYYMDLAVKLFAITLVLYFTFKVANVFTRV